MKKLHALLFSIFFLSVNVNADIPRNSIANVKQLTWSEIIAVVSDTYQFGLINLEMNADGSDIFYPIDEKFGRLPENGVGQYLYRIHEFNEYSKYESLIDERWTVGKKNNQICYGETGDEIDDYGCFYVFEGFANGEKYLYFSETLNGDFYARVNRIVKTKNESSFDQWSAESEKFSKENILYVQKYLSEVNNASKVKYTYNSYGEVELDFSSETFCVESPKAQVRNGLFYLPNQQKPYSGENLCVYLSNGQYYSQGKIKDGLRDGTWTYWNENGQKKSVATYKDNQIERQKNYQNGALINETQYTYYENGQIKAELSHKDGKAHGKMTTWFENGKKRGESNYKEDKKDGKFTHWYSTGAIKSESNYKNDKLYGKFIWWHENGQKYLEVNNKDDKLDGKETYWFENGQIQSVNNYKDGKRNGKQTSWYENGQIQSVNNYKDDKLDGEMTWWYKNGHKWMEGNYKNGKGDGKWVSWFENGQKEAEENYKDGKLDGKWTRWNENGQIKAELNYKDGKQVSEKQVYEELIALKSAYVNNIAARVKSFWRYQGADDDWNCDVYVQQSVEGVVEAVNIQNCTLDDSDQARAFKNSIERAIYKSSPLPSAPDDAVFDREIMFTFRSN